MIRGREAVKKVIQKCLVCLKHEGLPCGTHQPSDLPNARVSDDRPFSHVGLDFAVPMFLNSKDKEADNETPSKKSMSVFLQVLRQELYTLNSVAF